MSADTEAVLEPGTMCADQQWQKDVALSSSDLAMGNISGNTERLPIEAVHNGESSETVLEVTKSAPGCGAASMAAHSHLSVSAPTPCSIPVAPNARQHTEPAMPVTDKAHFSCDLGRI